jgi:hypothetical protein
MSSVGNRGLESFALQIFTSNQAVGLLWNRVAPTPTAKAHLASRRAEARIDLPLTRHDRRRREPPIPSREPRNDAAVHHALQVFGERRQVRLDHRIQRRLFRTVTAVRCGLPIPTTGAGAGLNVVASVTKRVGRSKPNWPRYLVSDDHRVSPAEEITMPALCAFAVAASAYVLNVLRREKLSTFAFYGLGVRIYAIT